MKHTFRYPKLSLLVCTYLLTYALFEAGLFDSLPRLLQGYGYSTMFAGGLLFSFGFTTPLAIAIFVEMTGSVHPLLGAAVAGAGAMLSDLLIFRFVRFSFLDELHILKNTQAIRRISAGIRSNALPKNIRQSIRWSIAGIIIASPLPDELGVSLLSENKNIQEKPFAAFCFLLDTLGVLIVLVTARAVSEL